MKSFALDRSPVLGVLDALGAEPLGHRSNWSKALRYHASLSGFRLPGEGENLDMSAAGKSAARERDGRELVVELTLVWAPEQ